MRPESLVTLSDGEAVVTPIALLRQLVASGFVSSTREPVTVDSVLTLTATGCEALEGETTMVEREERHADEKAFELLAGVLDGGQMPPFDNGASKMLRIMMGSPGTDSIISPATFIVHFGVQRRRRPNTYYRRLAPPALGELLKRSSVERVTTPVVIGLPPGTVPMVPKFPAWSYGPKLVWLVPSDGMLEVVVRDSSESWRNPYVGDIPREGSLALRKLPEWAPRVIWANLEAPIACPHCGARSISYRRISEALVCVGCGRSFAHA